MRSTVGQRGLRHSLLLMMAADVNESRALRKTLMWQRLTCHRQGINRATHSLQCTASLRQPLCIPGAR